MVNNNIKEDAEIQTTIVLTSLISSLADALTDVKKRLYGIDQELTETKKEVRNILNKKVDNKIDIDPDTIRRIIEKAKKIDKMEEENKKLVKVVADLERQLKKRQEDIDSIVGIRQHLRMPVKLKGMDKPLDSRVEKMLDQQFLNEIKSLGLKYYIHPNVKYDALKQIEPQVSDWHEADVIFLDGSDIIDYVIDISQYRNEGKKVVGVLCNENNTLTNATKLANLGANTITDTSSFRILYNFLKEIKRSIE